MGPSLHREIVERVCPFLLAAITNCHKPRSKKHQRFILSQFKRAEVQTQSPWACRARGGRAPSVSHRIHHPEPPLAAVPSSTREASRVAPGVHHHIAFFSLRQLSLCQSLITLEMASHLGDPGSRPIPRSLTTLTKSLWSRKVTCLQIPGTRASLWGGETIQPTPHLQAEFLGQAILLATSQPGGQAPSVVASWLNCGTQPS